MDVRYFLLFLQLAKIRNIIVVLFVIVQCVLNAEK